MFKWVNPERHWLIRADKKGRLNSNKTIVLVVRLRTLEMVTMVFSSKNEEATKVAPISGQRSMGDIHWEGPKSCLITANPDLIHLSTEKQFTEAEILLSLIRIFSKSLRAAFSIH